MSMIAKEMIGGDCTAMNADTLETETGALVGLVERGGINGGVFTHALVLNKDHALCVCKLEGLKFTTTPPPAVEQIVPPGNEEPKSQIITPPGGDVSLILVKITRSSPFDWYKDRIGAQYWVHENHDDLTHLVHRSENEVGGKWIDKDDCEIVWRQQ